MSSIVLRPRNRKRAISDDNKPPIQKRSKKTRQNSAVAEPIAISTLCSEAVLSKMQDFEIGLDKLDLLSCRETIPTSIKTRGHAPSLQTHQLSRPIPSEPMNQLQENIPPSIVPVQKQTKALRRLPTAQNATTIRTLASGRHAQFLQSSTPPASPLPHLNWADSEGFWLQMRAKDICQETPETNLMSRHPCILPSMRTILLDWILEVCEEYKLHRETFYLTVDLYDRFMDAHSGIQKEELQLIGITCLFIAAKLEEIYPPKVTDFAYVTDGACSVQEILDVELHICKVLKWRLTQNVSVNTWMNTYLQLISNYFRPPGLKAKEFEYPAYSPLEFIRAMQVLDLCTLDISSRQFSSSILAASALYLVSDKCRQHLQLICGLQLSDISLCVQWLSPCVTVINSRGPCSQKSFRGVQPQDAHNIQTHEINLVMLDEASVLRQRQNQMDYTTNIPTDCSAFMTPPRQDRRCLAPLNGTVV